MRTTPSGVSWADLSAQTMPSYRANAHEAGKATNSGAGTKSGRNWSPHGQAQVWLPGHGHGRLGGFSTLNMQAWRNDASVCSLSQILETGPIPSRYYLSVKACLGIIRRAAKRGKELPALLARALKAVVTSARISNARADCSQSDSGGGNTSGPIDVAACLTAKGQRVDFEVETFIADVAGRNSTGGDRQPGTSADTASSMLVAPTLGAVNPTAVAIQAGALRENPQSGPDGAGFKEDVAYTLEARAEVQAVATEWAVRRLTPTECERLQGYPDGHTLIEFGSRRTVEEDEAAYLMAHGAHVICDNEGRFRANAAADGPRYKGLGNAWAVKCVRPIAKRIMERQAA